YPHHLDLHSFPTRRSSDLETGLRSEQHTLPATTSTEELLDLVGDLNRRDDVDGILVQLPLPKQIDEASIIEAIDPAKDVDGFHPINVGLLAMGRPRDRKSVV